MENPPRRKGAMRRSEIPPDVLRDLNEGREETITLVEWLAIDMPTLLRSISPGVGLSAVKDELDQHLAPLADKGITQRLRGIGEAVYSSTLVLPNKDEIFERLASHTSDMVRAWASFMLTIDTGLSLEERLRAARRFAADRSVAVRECAWDSFRPYIADDLRLGLRLLDSWVRDPDPNIRRCGVEATRPRGVWTAHIEALKQDPEPALKLLEVVRSDPSRYVQRSVGNWLNDASKSRPDWVVSVCSRWTQESATQETAWTVNHALRTLRKKGNLAPT